MGQSGVGAGGVVDRYTILTDRLNVSASALAAQFQFHTDTKHKD